MLRIFVSVLIFSMPTMAMSCLPPWYSDLEYYIRGFETRDTPYQIVFGHFISISEIEVEDITADHTPSYEDPNYVAKRLTASAVFELVDPVPSRRRNGPVDVEIWKRWDNGSWDCNFGESRSDAYLDISFDYLLERDDEVLAFEIGPDGELSYALPLFAIHFGEPFTPTQRRALRRCIFNDACDARELDSLRAVEPVSR